MNEVFEAYAHYYDLFYSDKGYAAEAQYVADQIRRFSPSARRILELGCGTGAHAEHLARMGFDVVGVDMSETMLARAKARQAGLPVDVAARLTFMNGDARNLRIGETYDVVVSLFHVMSYQTANSDLEAAFSTAASHLTNGGVFLFDFWYGPAVLSQRPEVRVKRLVNEMVRILRIAEPEMFSNQNRVDVNYSLLIEDIKTGRLTRMFEKHSMRYFFKPELELLMKYSGFRPEYFAEWMTEQPMSCDGWSSVLVARRLV